MSKVVTKTRILVRPTPGGATLQVERTTIRTEEVFVTLGNSAIVTLPDTETDTVEAKDIYADPDKEQTDGEAKPPQNG